MAAERREGGDVKYAEPVERERERGEGRRSRSCSGSSSSIPLNIIMLCFRSTRLPKFLGVCGASLPYCILYLGSKENKSGRNL